MQSNVLDFERNADEAAKAADTARRWIARIDAGDLSSAERAELKDWLAQHPSHARLLDEHALLWAAAGQAKFPQAAKAPAARRALRRQPWAWGGGAVLAGVLALGLMRLEGLLPGPDALTAALHRTAVGERQSVLLPDGSRTELNAASTLGVA